MTRLTITIPRDIEMMVLHGDSEIDPEDSGEQIATARCIRSMLDLLGWKPESDVPGSENYVKDDSAYAVRGSTIGLADITIVSK
jgi:hypothetical protein